MNVFAFGEPHSLRRYIEFGIIAGVVAATLAAALGVSLPLVGAVAAAVAGGLAGRRRGLPSTEGYSPDAVFHVKFPGFAVIALVIFFVVAFAVSKCGVPTPGTGVQQSVPIR